jgi:tocopherol O-methyltransferase
MIGSVYTEKLNAQMTDISYKQAVISYYDKAEVSYRDIWDLDRSMALHYGYWDETVRSFPQSLMKMNQVLAHKLRPEPGWRILDAGCGVGGSSIFLAGEYGCCTTGISLSEKQVEAAKRNAIKKGMNDKCSFLVGDYTHTPFAENSFDAIWALESVCHAPDKSLFLEEAFRILKPGGKLILADGFKRPVLSQNERALLMEWLHSWSIIDLEDIDRMHVLAASSGFAKSESTDLKKHVMPTSLRLYRFGLMARYYGKMKRMLGGSYGNEYTIKNAVGAIGQYQALKKNLWSYFLFYAEKEVA